MPRIPNYVDLNKAKRPLQCFYCSEAFITFRALIQHLKEHEGDRFLSCRACNLRKRHAKRSELQSADKHSCHKKYLVWHEVTRDSLANCVLHVFDHPVACFLAEWGIHRRVRKRLSTLSTPVLPPQHVVTVSKPTPGPSISRVVPKPPVLLKASRKQPVRRCKGKIPAALGRAPIDPVDTGPVNLPPVIPVIVPPHVATSVPSAAPGTMPFDNLVPIGASMVINPFIGPLAMDQVVDNEGGECPPPSIPVPLVVNSDMQPGQSTPYMTTSNPSFGVSNYPSSEDSVGDPVVPINNALGMLNSLGLIAVRVPTPVLELGAEILSSASVPFADFVFHPGMSIVMPSERAELVQMNQRQYYRIPATHCATGAMVYLITPVEMGPPTVIFAQFRQFRALDPPVLPGDCDWLTWNDRHRVQLVSRCLSFP